VTITIIGADPGLANFGIAAVDLTIDDDKAALFVTDWRVISTAKSSKKQAVFASDDTLRRAQEIGDAIAPWLANRSVMAICCEAFSAPRNASAAAKIAMAFGVLAEAARARGIPVIYASPQAIKLAVCGQKSASKDEVIAAVKRAYGAKFLPDWPRATGKHEHVADAAAAVLACYGSPAVQGIIRWAQAAHSDAQEV